MIYQLIFLAIRNSISPVNNTEKLTEKVYGKREQKIYKNSQCWLSQTILYTKYSNMQFKKEVFCFSALAVLFFFSNCVLMQILFFPEDSIETRKIEYFYEKPQFL